MVEPVGQRAVEQQLALVGDLVADQQVEVAEAQREEQPRQGRVEADAGRAAPAGLGAGVGAALALAGRIVELRLARPGDDVFARLLAEVDARFGDLGRAVARDRRQVADEEPRLALVGDLVDRHHRGADAVGVDDPLVDEPGRPRVLGEVQLAGRQHHLALDVVDDVAVGVDVVEVVVAADGLELVERVPERSVIPQPGVAERVRLLLDRRRRSRTCSPWNGRSSQSSSPYASRVMAMLLPM